MPKFVKGQSGNPAGRAKGPGRVAEFRAALDGVLPGVLKKVVEAAMAGDMTAARIVINKVLPDAKPVDTMTPNAMGGTTLSDKATSILEAVAAGDVTIDAGASVVGMLQRVGELRDTESLVRRVEALEKLAKAQCD